VERHILSKVLIEYLAVIGAKINPRSLQDAVAMRLIHDILADADRLILATIIWD
jgi:hypothetical protein